MAALLALPNGDGRSEHTLPAEDPVPAEGVGPVLEPDLHKLGEPVDLVRPLEDLLLEIRGLQEPLGDLQELDGCVTSPTDGDLLRVVLLLDHESLVLEVLNGGLPGLQNRHAAVLAGELGHLALLVDSLLHLELVLHGPFEIVLVSDGTDHDVSGSVIHLDLGVGDDLDLPSEQRRYQLLADELGLLLVVGVHRHGLTGTEQLGPGSGDEHVLVLVVGEVELDVIQLVHVVLVLDLSIRQSGHTAGAPVDREVSLVDESPLEQVDEGKLSDPPVVRGVRLVVDAGVHGFPEHLIIVSHLLDEAISELFAKPPVLLSGSVELVDSVLLLDLDLDRGSVDIETEREEHVESVHPLVTCSEVDHGVSGRVSKMERSGCVSGRTVDAEDRLV